MSRHWTEFVTGVTDMQAVALDRMAARTRRPRAKDGLDLIAYANGWSRSKASNQLSSYPASQQAIQVTFRRYRHLYTGDYPIG